MTITNKSFTRFLNSIISENDLSSLRPCPSGSINPMEIEKVIGKKLKINKKEGEALYWKDLI